MHENLKMRVKLKEGLGWQPIAGRQHLGTFYMLYFEFISYEKKDGGGGTPDHEYTFNFKIQNFAGPTTFGLSPKPFPLPTFKDQFVAKIKKDLKAKLLKQIRIELQEQYEGEELIKRVKKELEKRFDKELEKLLEKEGWNVRFNFNIYPFFKNEEVKNIIYILDEKLEETMVLDININDSLRAGILYNPNNPADSLYADPTHWKRDGEDWLRIKYHQVKDDFDIIRDGEGRPGGICYPRRAEIM